MLFLSFSSSHPRESASRKERGRDGKLSSTHAHTHVWKIDVLERESASLHRMHEIGGGRERCKRKWRRETQKREKELEKERIKRRTKRNPLLHLNARTHVKNDKCGR